MNRIYSTGIHEALERLAQGAGFGIGEDETYESIVWFSETIPKPSKEQVEAEIAKVVADFESTEYQRLRAAEYPDFKQYLDGIVKGDEAQVQAYIDACLAIKAKYPKPE